MLTAWSKSPKLSSVTETKKIMAENARGVTRSLARDESAREERTPTPLRNEAQLNCVSLRCEFDCEVTWGAVKGQVERPLRGALDSSPSQHRKSMQLRKELIKDGRHVGLDFYDLLIEAFKQPGTYRIAEPECRVHPRQQAQMNRHDSGSGRKTGCP